MNKIEELRAQILKYNRSCVLTTKLCLELYDIELECGDTEKAKFYFDWLQHCFENVEKANKAIGSLKNEEMEKAIDESTGAK